MGDKIEYNKSNFIFGGQSYRGHLLTSPWVYWCHDPLPGIVTGTTHTYSMP